MTTSDPYWPRASDWLACGDTDPQLVVVGVPTSTASISPSEAWRTPQALRQVLRRFSTFDGERAQDLRDLAVADHGDWPIAHLSTPETVEAIDRSTSALDPGPVHVFLGGDNVITYPLVRSLPHAPMQRRGLITFDAHHDVRTLETGLTNGAPVRALLDAGLAGDHVVQIGIHSFANSGEYRQWTDDHGIRVVTMGQVDDRGIERVVADALDQLADRCDAIHVDFDIDVLDRAFAPACPGARPGGMTPRQLAAAARIVGGHPKVVSADLVEVDVTRDVADSTVMSMATTFLAFASGVATRPA
jgi:formiminoglutamase